MQWLPRHELCKKQGGCLWPTLTLFVKEEPLAEHKYITQIEAEAAAMDPWQVIRLRLGTHEQFVAAEGTHGAGAFASRNRLLEAIAAYARSKRGKDA